MLHYYSSLHKNDELHLLQSYIESYKYIIYIYIHIHIYVCLYIYIYKFLPRFMYRTFIIFICFLKTLQSFYIFTFFLTYVSGITWTITYIKNLYSLKSSTELFWVRYFGAHYEGIPLVIESC